jgi:hypothetical protein
MLALPQVQENRSVAYAAGEPQLVYFAHSTFSISYLSLSSVIGFLFGFSLASSFAAYRLLDEYKQASATLQTSVEELQNSTEKVRLHFAFNLPFPIFL